MNGCLTHALQGWKDFTKQEKYYKTVMKRFASRMANRGLMAALSSWQEYYKTRKWLRGLLNRCLGGKDVRMLGAGFRTWHQVSEASDYKHTQDLTNTNNNSLRTPPTTTSTLSTPPSWTT